VLNKTFIEEVDYKVKKTAPEVAGASFDPEHGGQNK
jgi:hypothetical protein